MAIQKMRGSTNTAANTLTYCWKFANNAAAIAAQTAMNTAEGFPLTVGSTTIANCMELRTAAGVYLYEPHGLARAGDYAAASRVTMNQSAAEVAIADRMIDIGGDPFDVVIVMGQSNQVGLSGAGTLVGGTDDVDVGAFQLDQNEGCVAAIEPFKSPTEYATQIGPWHAFATAWIAAGKVAAGRRLLIVPCAVGSTSILTDWNSTGRRFTRMTERAYRSLDISGNQIIALFGAPSETDAANSVTAAAYTAALDASVAAFRARFGASIPYVLSKPGDAYTSGTATDIKAAIDDTPNRIANCAVAATTGLALVDGTHFTAASYRTLGANYSTALDTLIPATVPSAPTIGTATAGDEEIEIEFTPGDNGGAAVSVFTATASPSGLTGTGASSPITITGLTNGVAQTVSVTATNVVGTSSASAASNSVTPEAAGGDPNALWPDLDMDDVYFNAGEPFNNAALANVTGPSYDIEDDADWAANIGSNRELVIKSGAALSDKVWSDCDDLRIVIENGATVGGLRPLNGARIHVVTDQAAGVTGTGLINGSIQFGTSGFGGLSPTDVIVERLCHTNGGVQNEFGPATRIAYLGMRAKDVFFNYQFADLLVAGCNFDLTASGWWMRLEDLTRRVIVVDCDVRTIGGNAVMRLSRNVAANGDPIGAVLVKHSLLYNANAEAYVFRINDSTGGLDQSVESAVLDTVRLQSTGSAAMEAGPTADRCTYFRRTNCTVAHDGTSALGTPGSGEDWAESGKVEIASGTLPAIGDYNSAGDPSTL